jgi:hypothetical protein
MRWLVNRRRWWLVALVALGVYLFALFDVDRLVPLEGRISEANYYQIATGMTRDDVVRMLGRPGGYHKESATETWVGRRGVIFVAYDESGNVKSKEFFALYYPSGPRRAF